MIALAGDLWGTWVHESSAQFTRARRRVRRWWCGRRGHEMELAVTRTRLFLRCVGCGHESPGWRLARDPG